VQRSFDAFATRWVAMHTDTCAATRLRGEQSEELLDLRMACLSERLEGLRAKVDVLSGANATVVASAFQLAEADTDLGGCADAVALRASIRPPKDAETRMRVETLRRKVARARALERAGRYAEGAEDIPALLAEAEAIQYRPVQAEALLAAGLLREGAGQFDDAVALLKKAALAASAAKDDEGAVRAFTRLVWVDGDRRARFDAAHDWARFAEASLHRIGDKEESLGELLRNEGDVYYREQRFVEAEALAQRALGLLRHALGPEHSSVVEALRDLGNVRWSTGRYDEALRDYGQALAIWERTLGPEHPNVAMIVNNIGNVQGDRGERAEALASYERALRIWERALGPEHPYVGMALFNLGVELRDAGRLDEALGAAERALALYEKGHGAEHIEVANAQCLVGAILARRGRTAEALARFESARAMRTRLRGENDPELAEALVGIGGVYLDLQRAASAVAPLERALALLAQDGDPGYRADAQFLLAKALTALGRDRERALALVREAQSAYRTNPDRYRSALRDVDAWLDTHR
jgi:tetratricopeptide (TPR) repeat protein